ncbi:uncharacterized protein B0H18DRAFT_871662 [Fomitopsis serialis]|uniref:uncharacterized protein n=1 Tax=Fomitopsis serialis TaxID=139415 RepID=UPI00200877B3|nr:uncharacterized protein B0H18DRAFT_871662 [Neoantrodia serialis]KAH9931815.1 hypothetical protein B0H18DRAFT_871662 [Neoantrodia serialis]
MTWLRKLQSSGLPDQLRAMAAYSYGQAVLKFVDTTEGRRVCYMLAAANGVVWAVWQIPRMQGVMLRTFAHHPLSGLSYTMLTSTFSHSAFFHLLFNMMALLSFGSSADVYLTLQQRADPSNLRESTSQWHFLSFFISAGLFSSLVSHVATARIKYPQLIAQLANPAKTAAPAASIAEGAAAVRSTSALTGSEALTSIKPSLGASGAIYATLTLTAMAFPETHVSLIFPRAEIPIQYGVCGFMALDLMGVIRGWRRFDHYAHLGGAMFGLWYYAYGPKVWESFREMTLAGCRGRSRRRERVSCSVPHFACIYWTLHSTQQNIVHRSCKASFAISTEGKCEWELQCLLSGIFKLNTSMSSHVPVG